MTRDEIRLQVAISCIQGVIEAKHGIIGEALPVIAVKESLRMADKFVEEWFKETKPETNDSVMTYEEAKKKFEKEWVEELEKKYPDLNGYKQGWNDRDVEFRQNSITGTIIKSGGQAIIRECLTGKLSEYLQIQNFENGDEVNILVVKKK